MIRKCYVMQKEWEKPEVVPILWGKKSYGKESYAPIRIPVAVMEWEEYEALIKERRKK